MRNFWVRATSSALGAPICVWLALVPADAQSIGTSSIGNSLLSPNSTASIEPFGGYDNSGRGLQVGTWILSPSLFTGVSLDDNVYQTSNAKRGDVAARISPSLSAVRNTGIHNTQVDLKGDFYIYNTHANADQYNGSAAISHTWEAQRDLIFKFGAGASRATDTLSNGQIASGLVLRPTFYEQYQASASVFKSFDRFFVGLGGSVYNANYDDTKTASGRTLSQKTRDYLTTTISGRAGYRISPVIYSYAEAAGNWQNYYNSTGLNSNGYRAVVGLGSERISLFQGEVYAGYQQQFYDRAAIGNPSGGILGGKVSWVPTQYITVSANVDESIGTQTYVNPANPVGSSTYVTTVGLTGSYAFARTWTAAARVGYAHTSYKRGGRNDDQILAGGTLNYHIWGNFDATLDYQFSQVNSNYAAAKYTRNVVSLGTTYRY